MAIIEEPDGSISASEVSVPGVIRDDYGNEWTIPADEASYDELLTDPLKLPRKDPRFHYQFVRQDQVTAKATEGFRLVQREEVGVSDIVTQADVGGPQTTYHQVHDLFLMKIPQQLAERRYAAAKRMADDAVAQINNPESLAKAGGSDHALTRSPEPFDLKATKPDLDNFAEPTGSFASRGKSN